MLKRIADDDAHLDDLFDLDDATNDRLQGEMDLLPGIGRDELVAGIPYASIINASFCHASPEGGRFNGPDRGAWYAGLALETSQTEVGFRKSRHYLEVGWEKEDIVTYDDYLGKLRRRLPRHPGRRGFLPPAWLQTAILPPRGWPWT